MRHPRGGRSRCGHCATLLTVSLILLVAQPSMAIADFKWEGSTAEHVLAQTVDVVLIRPLALLRVAVGAAIFLPAALVTAPGGRTNIEEVYDIFVAESVDYAFRRKLGDL